MAKLKSTKYGDKKIAIECDGDRFHYGEDKIIDDTIRQTILERLGWRFIRIRGSEYFRYPEETMKRVFNELEKYEIFPETILDDTISIDKDINWVSWNGNVPKYDLREWDSNHEKMGKGITLKYIIRKEESYV